MKKEDLFEAIGEIDDAKVRAAGEYRGRRKKVFYRRCLAGVCALLVICFIVLRPSGTKEPAGVGAVLPGPVTVKAEYPASSGADMSAQSFMEGSGHWDWWQSYRDKVNASAALRGDLDAYDLALMKDLLAGADENIVCSPLNTYIAFAMLAEISAGETRAQILDALGAADIETLRTSVRTLWEANYADTPILKSLLADSLWLNDSVGYDTGTLEKLAEHYYASAFSGKPGSEAMDEALRTWTDENTGGLLSEYTKDLSLDPETVLALVSAVYYKAMWVTEFRPEDNTTEVFHGTKGDTETEMMHRQDLLPVFRTDAFTALDLALTDSGSVCFILPEPGVDVDALAGDPDILKAARSGQETEGRIAEVGLAVPKFKVSARRDLRETMAALGISDALDPARSDFSPLTEGENDLYLSSAEHAALVEVDEQGVSGAAYTAMAFGMGALIPEEKVEFILDRPFLFLITGRDGSILFAGIVRNIS